MIDEHIAQLLDRGEEEGCLNLSALHEFVAALDLDEEQLEALYEQIDERGIELSDDCGRAAEADDALGGTYVNGDLAAATTDALQLFLNEAARYPLLTAAEEVELAKRIERGDPAAKERMINSNLDRKSTRLNSSHANISYAVFCLKKQQ